MDSSNHLVTIAAKEYSKYKPMLVEDFVATVTINKEKERPAEPEPTLCTGNNRFVGYIYIVQIHSVC